MSILEDLLAAIKENTATLKALSGKTSAAAAADKPKSTGTTKPKDEEADEAPKRGRGRPPKEKALSATEMAEKARAFAEGAGDDEAEFKARRKHLTKLAEKYGVEKFSAIKGEDQAEALASLKEFEEAGDEGDGDEGDGY